MTLFQNKPSNPIYKHPAAGDRLHFQLLKSELDGFGTQHVASRREAVRVWTQATYNSSTPRISRGTLYTVHVALYSSKKKSSSTTNNLGDGVQQALHTIQGICIKKKNRGINSFFCLSERSQSSLRRNNESIIQTFPLYSPFISRSGRP